MNRAQAMTKDVAALMGARNSLLWIVSKEEQRVVRSLIDAASSARYDVRFWDCGNGITDVTDKEIDPSGDPANALRAVKESKKRELWILKDLAAWLRDPTLLRALRNLAISLPNAPRNEARCIVILTPSSEIPPELTDHATVINWPIPDRAEIANILDNCVASLRAEIQGKAAPWTIDSTASGKRDAAIDAALGLTAEEASSCYAKSLVTLKSIDAKAVGAEKKSVIAREKVLEWFEPEANGLDAIGGLDNLKGWLTQRKCAFSQRARDFGLPSPKGVMLVGISGCGKSLTAKAVASAWGMPLLRMDLGALKSKWVGESEGNIRKALAVAETVAPCIVWLDEIEKALGGATQGAADGGVSADALGAILNWMQERKGNVFVVATANDISALPPELMRKGRFDEIFFVDTPSAIERKEVFTAALKQHNRTADGLDLDALVSATHDYTGAEIASTVPEALFTAFADGERALSTSDLANAARTVVPLVKTAAEKIAKLREWAKTRARSASSTKTESTTTAGRKLDL